MARQPELLGLSAVLNDLLAAMAGSRSQTLVDYDTVRGWEPGVLEGLIAQGLLKIAPVASILACEGCEEHCFKHVVVRNDGITRAQIVCEVPERQAEMGLVTVPLARLQQWQSSPAMLTRFVAGALGLDAALSPGKAGAFHLGMLQGPHGRRGVVLSVDSFSLEVNQHSIPLLELLFAEQGIVMLDMLRVESVMSQKVNPAAKPYESNTDRREYRKQATAVMRQD